MDDEGRSRAAALLRRKAAGMSAAEIADRGDIPDPQTVRDFLDGNSWPWARTRARMESAVGLERGSLDLAARGDLEVDDEEDPVISALKASPLSRGDRAKVEALYFDLLDAAEGRRGA